MYKLRKSTILLLLFCFSTLHTADNNVNLGGSVQKVSYDDGKIVKSKSLAGKKRSCGAMMVSMWGYNLFFIGSTIYYILKNKDRLHFSFSVYDPFVQFIAVYWIISLVVYCIYNSSFLNPYKVNRDPQAYEPNYALVILQVLINQFINFVPVQELVGDLPATSDQGWGETLLGALVTYLWYTVVFYTVHRLIHTPTVYQHIHGIHHEFEVPLGFTAMYAHPLEGFLDVVPLLIGMWMSRISLVAARIWMVVGILNTIIVHTNAGRHSLHHLFHKCNFSTDDMDFFFGTEYGLKSFNRGKNRRGDLAREKWIEENLKRLPGAIKIRISRAFQVVSFLISFLLTIFAFANIYNTKGLYYGDCRVRKKGFIILWVSLPICILSILSMLFVHDIVVNEDCIKLNNVLGLSLVIPYGKVVRMDKKIEYGKIKGDKRGYIKSLILIINYESNGVQKRIFLSEIDYSLRDLLLLEEVMKRKGGKVLETSHFAKK